MDWFGGSTRPCFLEPILNEDWIVNAIKLALLLFALPATVAAAESECFCLQNKDDHFRHSCEMQQQGPRQVAQCRDDAGNPYKIDDLSGWTVEGAENASLRYSSDRTKIYFFTPRGTLFTLR